MGGAPFVQGTPAIKGARGALLGLLWVRCQQPSLRITET